MIIMMMMIMMIMMYDFKRSFPLNASFSSILARFLDNLAKIYLIKKRLSYVEGIGLIIFKMFLTN